MLHVAKGHTCTPPIRLLDKRGKHWLVLHLDGVLPDWVLTWLPLGALLDFLRGCERLVAS